MCFCQNFYNEPGLLLYYSC
ncbi:hypothetical protein LINGRAPRIM_LOCUS2574 [Linum grandiflorum]